MYSETARYQSIFEAREALAEMKLDEEQLHLACIPSTPKARQAYYWMSDYFKMHGDVAPNRDNLVQLPGFFTKEGIYEAFKKFVTAVYTGDENEVASETLFRKIWGIVYPRVKLARYCQVTGKCHACYWIYERQELLGCAKDIQDLRKFTVVHKTMVEQERRVYMNKRQMAQLRPDMYWSLIIDGKYHACA